jgi:signal peptidase II
VDSDSPAREGVTGASGVSQAPRSVRGLLWVLVTAVVVIALDQLTKLWAQQVLLPRIVAGEGPIEILGSWLRLTYAENTGAAFSMGTGLTWIFTLIACVVAVVIIRVATKLTNIWWALALGGLLGGAVGNLTDRIFRAPGVGRGFVVDFIQVPYWPIFNIADSAVVVSAIAMVFLAWRGVPLTAQAQPARDSQ